MAPSGQCGNVMGDDAMPVFGLWHVDRDDWESTLPRHDEADKPAIVASNEIVRRGEHEHDS
jgi:hypothetical protein